MSEQATTRKEVRHLDMLLDATLEIESDVNFWRTWSSRCKERSSWMKNTKRSEHNSRPCNNLVDRRLRVGRHV
jgi:hypothetical protein